jgi:hypothetical protein
MGRSLSQTLESTDVLNSTWRNEHIIKDREINVHESLVGSILAYGLKSRDSNDEQTSVSWTVYKQEGIAFQHR